MDTTLTGNISLSQYKINRLCDKKLYHTCDMDTNTLAERLRSARKTAGMTQTELAKKAKVSQTTISDIERGRNQGSAELPRIAASLGVTVESLTGIGSPLAKNSHSPSQSKPHTTTVLVGLEPWADGDPLSADEVDLPYFEDVAFAAGDGSFLSQVGDHAGRKLRFLRETLRSAGVDIAHAACAKNSGNSMEDLIRDGATIGIDISKAELPIRDGKIYAMFHGGILRVKYLHRLPGGGVRLRSHNRDEYPDEDLSREQLADFRVLGWVFWWSTVDRW